MPNLRVLFDSAGEGAWNMAVDEALLASAAASNQATLRCYTWIEPTLSLGYFQAASDRELHAASLACPLVRRSTGGGAILHDRELTYSLAVPAQGSAAAASGLYELVHRSLIEALAGLGIAAALFRDVAACASGVPAEAEPFLCFQRRTCFDVVIGGHKIAGSAQRRRGRAVLQHGSILLARSAYAPELVGIAEAAGVGIESAELAALLVPQVADSLRLSGSEGQLTETERTAASGFVETRFAAVDFLQRR